MRGSTIWRFALIAVVASALPVPVPGQPLATSVEPTAKAPTVALVLSGGGALGFAHVGVIQVLEEVGLSPDIVVGTSIGSIVGALYSVGYDGAAMERLINESDWNDTLFDEVDRRALSFEQKVWQSRYYLTTPVSDTPRPIDAGLSHAQEVVEYLDELLDSYPVEVDFDTLPRRFRIVAADLVTGERVVYADGDLKTAIRASMGVPGLFTPIWYRDRLLIDGGWVDNTPATVAREMGADVVITVALGALEDDLTKLSTITEVSRQAYQIRIRERLEESFRNSDLVIYPNLTGFTEASFESGAPLLQRGYAAADEVRDELREIASASSTTPPMRSPGRSGEAIRIDAILVDSSVDATSNQAFADRLREEIGDRATFGEIRDAIYAEYDGGDYAHVWYRLATTGRGGCNVIVDAPLRDKPRSALGVSARFTGQIFDSSIASFSMTGAYQWWTGTDINSVVTGEVSLSQFPSVSVGWLVHPFATDLFVETGIRVAQYPEYFFKEYSVDALYARHVYSAGILFRQPLFRRAALNLAVFGASIGVGHRYGAKLLPEESWTRYGGSVAVDLDTLDRIVSPRRGQRLRVSLSQSIDDELDAAVVLDGVADMYHSLGQKVVLNPWAESTTLLAGALREIEKPSLGGRFTQHGYYEQEIRAENVAAAGLRVRVLAGSLPLGLGDEVYIQLAMNGATGWEEATLTLPEELDTFIGGGAGVVANTLVGELSLSIGMNQDYRPSAYLTLRTTSHLRDLPW